MFKRKNSHLVTDMHPYRKLIPFLMPTRNEAAVYYDTYVRAEKLEAYLESVKDTTPKITLTHVLIRACVLGFQANPTMNRYVSGYRLYQRDNIEITFSMKKEKVSRSPVKVVKMEFTPDETVYQIAQRISERVNVERSDKKSYVDKEIILFTSLPRFMLRLFVWLQRFLDSWNLLPYSFIKNDPLYASLFIANLGTIGMDAAYHHLYEYGTIPLFCAVGAIKDSPVVENGKVVPARLLHIRFSYDERIDDGLTSGQGIATAVKCLEDPEKYMGGPVPKKTDVQSG